MERFVQQSVLVALEETRQSEVGREEERVIYRIKLGFRPYPNRRRRRRLPAFEFFLHACSLLYCWFCRERSPCVWKEVEDPNG
jgi:hypothetical protein